MIDPELKVVLGIAAAIVAIFNYLPYLIGVIKKTLKPHSFSWIIWTLMTSIIFATQLADGAGPGAWAAGVTAITLFIIAAFSVRNKSYQIILIRLVSCQKYVLLNPLLKSYLS